jgi:hypothetical protein
MRSCVTGISLPRAVRGLLIPTDRPLVAGISISSVVFIFSTTCRIIVVACDLERAADCLCGRPQGRSVGSIQGGSDSLQIWMLILHRSSDIPMPHCPHHRLLVSLVEPRYRLPRTLKSYQ